MVLVLWVYHDGISLQGCPHFCGVETTAGRESSLLASDSLLLSRPQVGIVECTFAHFGFEPSRSLLSFEAFVMLSLSRSQNAGQVGDESWVLSDSEMSSHCCFLMSSPRCLQA